MGSQIAFVKAKDCYGVYINDKLVLEQYQLDVHEIAVAMMHTSFDCVTTYHASEKWVDSIDANYPENLADVVLVSGVTIAEFLKQ